VDAAIAHDACLALAVDQADDVLDIYVQNALAALGAQAAIGHERISVR
jgi:hypothetical protein